jgi:hypothetical protein
MKSKSKIIKFNDHVIDLSKVYYIFKSEKILKFVFLEEFDLPIWFATERDAETILDKCFQMMKGE